MSTYNAAHKANDIVRLQAHGGKGASAREAGGGGSSPSRSAKALAGRRGKFPQFFWRRFFESFGILVVWVVVSLVFFLVWGVMR